MAPEKEGGSLHAKLIWKGLLFSFSIFMLLLTMGFGSSGGTFYPTTPSYERFSGQAKIAAPGARTRGFRSVTSPEPVVVEKSIFAKIREATDRLLGAQNMSVVSSPSRDRSELQQLQRRRAAQGVPGGMAVQVMN